MRATNPLQDLLYFVRDPWLWGKPHEAAGIHRTCRQQCSRVAARGARAAAGQDAACRVHPGGNPRNDPFREEFVRGMRDLGYVEGRNIAYEFRHYGDDVESIPSLIGDLLRAKVDIIVVGGTAAIRAAQSATQSIPIVMGVAADPLESGLIAGLARPGGNTTGLSLLSAE